ncbi:UNVERIFIED_CONTAM: hypothetical protein K2H54_050297 [Gekko kuhli]
MSGDEEPNIPVTTGETSPVTTGTKVPLIQQQAPGHRPTELLDTTFNGTPEKLAFFVVRAQKLVMNWGHLFSNDEQWMDYIASQLQDGAADWESGHLTAAYPGSGVVKKGPEKVRTDTSA